MAGHCRHARFVWNLAVEQQQCWRPGRQAPGYNEQCAQLTAVRAEYDWLAAGSQTVQQQALRDFAQAMRNFFNDTRRRPTWRKAGTNVAQKRGLNHQISRQGWGLLVARLKHKAAGRLEYVPAAYTSQRCSHCGHTAPENRKSQAVFRCTACGYAANADVNAARNIAAGHAVKARGGDRDAGPVNREPQLTLR